MVKHDTLVSGKGVTVAGGTLGSSTDLTLGAVALGARRLQISVLQSGALLAVVGMVLSNVQRTPHAARTMRSAVKIVSILQWLG